MNFPQLIAKVAGAVLAVAIMAAAVWLTVAPILNAASR